MYKLKISLVIICFLALSGYNNIGRGTLKQAIKPTIINTKYIDSLDKILDNNINSVYKLVDTIKIQQKIISHAK